MGNWSRTELETIADTVSKGIGLDNVLVRAVIQKESSWDPLAARYEPGFSWLWPTPKNISVWPGVSKDTEIAFQKTSWGLMQVMGSVLRQFGYKEPRLNAICIDPKKQIEIGCLLLKRLVSKYGVRDGLSAYNAGPGGIGTNYDTYADPVLKIADALKGVVNGKADVPGDSGPGNVLVPVIVTLRDG